MSNHKHYLYLLIFEPAKVIEEHLNASLRADITLQWLIQHSKSRRSWKWSLPSRSCGLSPLMVMGPWQPSLPLPLWSNPALSAHYRHHPVHYHRCVAPVQHYRHPNYCIWSLKKLCQYCARRWIVDTHYASSLSLRTCSVSVHHEGFFF